MYQRQSRDIVRKFESQRFAESLNLEITLPDEYACYLFVSQYMKKQTAALREVNNTRLKVYEQLEVSVQDLERANHHLVIENTSDKKLIKR